MLGIYKFYWGCGGMGDLKSLFIADDHAVKNAIGKEIYFGEVLGKHSEIVGELEEGDVVLVSNTQEDIDFFQRLDLTIGLNPLDFISEDANE